LKGIEGSNPSVSASYPFATIPINPVHHTKSPNFRELLYLRWP
jgi:hypothetical protein